MLTVIALLPIWLPHRSTDTEMVQFLPLRTFVHVVVVFGTDVGHEPQLPVVVIL